MLPLPLLVLTAQLTPLEPVAVFDMNVPQAPRELTCDDWMRRAPRCTKEGWREPTADAQAAEKLRKTEATLRAECTRDRSCVPLAIGLRRAGRGEEARPLLERACSGGNGWACAELGELLWRDRHVAQDFAAAHRAFAKACNADTRHCRTLGRFLEYHGKAARMPEQQAAFGKSEALRKASAPAGGPVWDGQDAPEGTRCLDWARRSVACRLKHGPALAQTADENAAWLAKNQANCARGIEIACLNVEATLFNSTRRPEAVSALARRCDAGSSFHCTQLGEAFAEGDHLPKDPARARRFFQRACELDADSCDRYTALLAQKPPAAGAEAAAEREGAAPTPPEPQDPAEVPARVPGYPAPDLGACLAPITVPATPTRARAAAVLYRVHDAFFPLVCVQDGKLLPAEGATLRRCLALLPARPDVRLMDGTLLRLSPLGSHLHSTMESIQGRGWGIPGKGAKPTATHTKETELAVWPPDADLGLVPLPVGATDRPPPIEVLEEALQRVGPGWGALFLNYRPDPSLEVLQAFQADGLGAVLSVTGRLRGVFVNPGAEWRVLRLAGPADLGTWVLARTDLDGNREPEWLVFTKCVNGFFLELWPSDFRKPLASYVDCGI